MQSDEESDCELVSVSSSSQLILQDLVIIEETPKGGHFNTFSPVETRSGEHPESCGHEPEREESCIHLPRCPSERYLNSVQRENRTDQQTGVTGRD